MAGLEEPKVKPVDTFGVVALLPKLKVGVLEPKATVDEVVEVSEEGAAGVLGEGVEVKVKLGVSFFSSVASVFVSSFFSSTFGVALKSKLKPLTGDEGFVSSFSSGSSSSSSQGANSSVTGTSTGVKLAQEDVGAVFFSSV